MRALPLLLLLASAMVAADRGEAADPAAGECAPEAGGGFHCVYRSLLPSAGIAARCRDDRDCRVGYYYGGPAEAVWLAPPPGMATLPRPEVVWHTATLAQVRFDCGTPCTVSYFFEARRRRLSEPRRDVLAVDHRRLLLAAVEGRALVVRQVFSWREVLRIERDWPPATWPGEALSGLRFDPDGRLSFTWLRGAAREPVSERISVPSFAR
jgi:hypothetical protein